MIWLSLTLAVLVAISMLAIVGGTLSWAVGLRGYWAVAAAPVFGFTVIAVASVVAPWLGLGWSVVPVAAVTAVLALGLALARRALGFARHPRIAGDRGAAAWLSLAVVAAGVLIGLRVLTAVGDPANFSQTFDNIFHLNAIRFILDTANASSLHVGQMTSPSGTLPFYPAAWHAFVALVVSLSGVSIPVGVNAVVLVVSAVVWPLGAVLLARTLCGTGPVVAVAAALAASGIPAFPLLLMDYGVLYPFQLGLALCPVALAAALRAMGLTATAAPPTLPKPWWALILAGTLPAIALAHPGAFVAVLALSLPMVFTFAWTLIRRCARWGRLAVVVGLLAYLGAGLVLLRILRPPLDARQWPPTMSIPDALLQVLAVSMWYALPSLVIAAAVLAGAVWAVVEHSRRSLLALSMYLVGVLLFVAVSSFTHPVLRDLLTGSWYNNIPRLAALLPLTLVPLAALGVDRTWAAIARILERRTLIVRRVGAGVAVSVSVVAGFLVATGPVATVADGMRGVYEITPTSPLITTDELALLNRLDRFVPPGVTVAGSAWTGAPLAFALADRPVLMPHTLMEISPDLQIINDGLDGAVAGGPVCRAVADLDVGFVLDFGTQEIFPGEHDYPGLDDLADSGAVRLVDREGDAKLYEVVACSGS